MKSLGNCTWWTKTGAGCRNKATVMIGGLGVCWRHKEVAEDVYYATLDRLSMQ